MNKNELKRTEKEILSLKNRREHYVAQISAAKGIIKNLDARIDELQHRIDSE